ncbi:Metal-nicotianamine transporter YSL3 -like protein [Gossypium arboreum]|uniref:Metal-nicotianamine transporter YSL3-like protein n=1 Tax=Gossypium arboreum TaxID=29729 RepID=A0A0B0PNT0_GOSAR|nr:Metal-nicotianamine transporter YSL3 -like protein [Gossypium arboreum]
MSGTWHRYETSYKTIASIAKLARGSTDVGDSITLSIGHLGIVSLNILSMACIGIWSFCYMSYWLVKYVGL